MQNYFIDKILPPLAVSVIIACFGLFGMYYQNQFLIKAVDEVPDTYLRKDVQIEVNKRLEQKMDLLLEAHDIPVPKQ